MPTPNLSLNFALTEDERRRRAVEEALRAGAFKRGATPINTDTPPRPVALPNIPTRPVPRPLPSPGIPGGAIPGGTPGILAAEEIAPPRPLAMPDMRNAPLPEFRPAPITRTTEYEGARDEAINRQEPRWKTALRNAGLGALRGLATGGGLGAGLGGAVAGGAYGAISPRGAREMEFEQFEKPKILERFAMEDRDAAARAAVEKAMREGRLDAARLGEIEAGIDLRRSQAEKNRLPVAPQKQTAQRRLGVNRQTGEPDYYDINNPAERKVFRPYIRETSTRPQRQAAMSRAAGIDLRRVDELKRKAMQAWEAVGKKPAGSTERQRAEAAAAQKQAEYNQAVGRFGELYGDQFEVGGYEGPNAWGYVKKRQGAAGAQPSQRKAVVGADFVKYVADTLGVSPERARQMIIEDRYEVR